MGHGTRTEQARSLAILAELIVVFPEDGMRAEARMKRAGGEVNQRQWRGLRLQQDLDSKWEPCSGTGELIISRFSLNLVTDGPGHSCKCWYNCLTYIELVVHAKYDGSLHRVGYTYHSCWKSSQTETQSPRKALTSTHNLWICVILKAAFQIHSAFFCLPLVSQTFSYLAALPWLPPHRLTVEEAGMCVKE